MPSNTSDLVEHIRQALRAESTVSIPELADFHVKRRTGLDGSERLYVVMNPTGLLAALRGKPVDGDYAELTEQLATMLKEEGSVTIDGLGTLMIGATGPDAQAIPVLRTDRAFVRSLTA